jgi:NhaA family Na+:H+ antiporter
LALLGKRVPAGLKVLLLALAIADDIGAIVVIAIFYSGAIHTAALSLAAAGLALVLAMNWIGMRSVVAYTIVGMAVWLAMLQSGIHPAITGVVLGLLTPVRARVPHESLVEIMLNALDRLDGKIDRPQQPSELIGNLTLTARETISPLQRLESSLHPWVAFLIMPIFALANAGVALRPAAASHGVAWAVAMGLVLGKSLGIFVFSWLAVQLRAANLPAGVSWRALLGAGCLGGIGFTMSLFIAGLALDGMLLDAAKIGTLAGSALSAVLGLALLAISLPSAEAIAKKDVGIDSE